MALTQHQIDSAQIVYNILVDMGYNHTSAIGIIGNVHIESAGTWSPTIDEYSGGGGFGLAQWTPKETLYTQASMLGLSRSEAETIEGQAKVIGSGDITGQWMVDVSHLDYGVGTPVVNPMTLTEFKQLNDLGQAVANFMAHWERPSELVHHYDWRFEAALEFNQEITGKKVDKKETKEKEDDTIILYLTNVLNWGSY